MSIQSEAFKFFQSIAAKSVNHTIIDGCPSEQLIAVFIMDTIEENHDIDSLSLPEVKELGMKAFPSAFLKFQKSLARHESERDRDVKIMKREAKQEKGELMRYARYLMSRSKHVPKTVMNRLGDMDVKRLYTTYWIDWDGNRHNE